MTLWTKPIEKITYTDVVEFCENKISEGINLDYKVDVPTGLPKVVSSFANTSGGLIIVGVTTDKHNKPDQIAGVANERGFTERVAQICRDNIHPPILPDMTQLLPLDNDKSKAVAVLRIAQSIESPHAIRNMDRIYIRRGDVTDCITDADINRIAYLLDRRKQLAGENEANIDVSIERMKRCLGIHPQTFVWWQVSPLYPWQSVWNLGHCVNANLGIDLRQAPRGSLGVGQDEKRNDSLGPTLFVSVDTRGMCFRGKLFYPPTHAHPALNLGTIAFQTYEFFSLVRRFYEHTASAYPGMMSLAVGFENVGGQQMVGHRGPGSRFPDESFRVDQIMTYDEFLATDFSPEYVSQSPMMSGIRHAFGVLV